MKQAVKDMLFGVLIFFSILALEFVLTLPQGTSGTEGISSAEWSRIINQELLLTALPAAVVTFLSAMLLNTKSGGDAFRRSVIWTMIVLLFYVAIGIGNGNFKIIFGTIGIYTVLLGVFAGPLFYAKIKHLK